MKRLVIKPDGFSCTYAEAPPGFILVESQLCFKSEYHQADGRPDGYCDTGEFLCIDLGSTVQPVIYEWEEYDAA